MWNLKFSSSVCEASRVVRSKSNLVFKWYQVVYVSCGGVTNSISRSSVWKPKVVSTRLGRSMRCEVILNLEVPATATKESRICFRSSHFSSVWNSKFSSSFLETSWILRSENNSVRTLYQVVYVCYGGLTELLPLNICLLKAGCGSLRCKSALSSFSWSWMLSVVSNFIQIHISSSMRV